jgi:hypothetical protein
MVWDRWLKDTHLRGLWTVDGPEALQWPGLGMRLGHGAPPLHVAAMSPSHTKGRTHSRMGPTLSCLSPPPTFSNPFPPHFWFFSPPLQAPPLFSSFASRSAAAFQSAAAFCRRILSPLRAELLNPFLHYSLFSHSLLLSDSSFYPFC